ncbi:serine arginine-rich splicing factor [Cichlidogyrus casuarinus]|uniref:Serine arginine-rich splicing factor n=1 Tax=Cichlidogyrus casuarinus TaxID=1844966 RepID=A0ABD2PV61_9PLAT
MSRVYVGRLPSRCSERDVERFFRDYGKIREIVLKNGYGFVEFDHHRDAEDAVYDLNGRELRGERVIIEHAKLPPGREGRGYGGFGYGGRKSYRESRYGPPTRTEYRAIVENLSSRISWQDLKDTMRKAGEVCYADAHRSNRNEGIATNTAQLLVHLVVHANVLVTGAVPSLARVPGRGHALNVADLGALVLDLIHVLDQPP